MNRVNEIVMSVIRDLLFFPFVNRARDPPVRPCYTYRYPNKGPFLVGNVVADVTDKKENSFCDIVCECPLFNLNNSV